MLKIEQQKFGEATVLRLVGDLEQYSAFRLIDTIDALLAGASRAVVVDLSETPFLDSSGIGALLAARQRLQSAGCQFSLCGMNSYVRGLLTRTQLDRLFSIHPDAHACLARISPSVLMSSLYSLN